MRANTVQRNKKITMDTEVTIFKGESEKNILGVNVQ